MKETGKMVLGIIGVLAIVTGVLFATGTIQNWYDRTVGLQHTNIQRTNFEQSTPYVHGKIDDLAKYKREYERAATPQEKAQVRNYILDQFANFDANLIPNADLYQFLKQMEAGR